MISVNNLGMRFGGQILFKNVSFQLNPGVHYGLVGANGSGKSTLIKILTNELTPETGDISIPSQVQIGSLKQSHFLYEDTPIRDVVLMGKPLLWRALKDKEVLLQKHHFSDSECETLEKLEKIIEMQSGYAAASEASSLLEGLGIPEKVHLNSMHILSGGYKLRVLLAQVLFSSPEVLLLDEPTNHLDIFSIRWLEDYLKGFPGTLLLSSHDRDFLNATSDYIVDLDYETFKFYKGNYTQFIDTKDVDKEQIEHQLATQDKKKQHLQDFVDRFKAKATKAAQAKSKMRLIEKLEDSMDSLAIGPSSRCYPRLNFEICRPSGATALKVHSISKAYGDKKVLHKISFEVERGDRVAFLGANGIGKSTLLEILTGTLPADEGSFEWGFAAYHAYFPQDHSRGVTGNLSLIDWLGQHDRAAPQEKLRDILGRVLFSGDDAEKRVHVLSGGEMARLVLAKIMLLNHNVLIFDEPTNHLDMESTEALLKGLENYSGTILIVSHNRYFISRIANRVIEMSHEGIHDFRGSYTDYVAWREAKRLSEVKKIEVLETQPSLSKLSYEDQKKQQRLKEQKQRKIAQLETLCHQLEQDLAEMDAIICQEKFYQEIPQAEQKSVLEKKSALEKSLNEAIHEWEKAHL